jgi:hypothetical protein
MYDAFASTDDRNFDPRIATVANSAHQQIMEDLTGARVSPWCWALMGAHEHQGTRASA